MVGGGEGEEELVVGDSIRFSSGCYPRKRSLKCNLDNKGGALSDYYPPEVVSPGVTSQPGGVSDSSARTRMTPCQFREPSSMALRHRTLSDPFARARHARLIKGL